MPVVNVKRKRSHRKKQDRNPYVSIRTFFSLIFILAVMFLAIFLAFRIIE